MNTMIPASPPAPAWGGALRKKSLWARAWSVGQFVLAFGLTLGVLLWLLLAPAQPPEPRPQRTNVVHEAVEVAGPKLVRNPTGTPLDHKLQSMALEKSSLHDPLFSVSGRVVASLRPGGGHGNDYWQFDAPEVLTAFTDWQKAQADVAFTKKQLTSIQELADTRLKSQERVVERLRKLVTAGTDTPKDLAVEETNLLQYTIQGRKEVHEAESAVRVAERNVAALARQLQQAGLEAELLKGMTV